MNRPSYPRIPSLIVTVLAGMLLPLSAFAQAGISGDPFSGQRLEQLRGTNSKFDTGFKSKSALGQLEELTGSKVDRSAPAQAPAPRAAPKISRSAQMRNQFNQEVAGMLADALIQAIFSDDSAKKKAAAAAAAAEAAAQAAAQAEAFRVQQELARLARIQQAQRQRAEWDARENEIGDRLGDAFTVGTGTAFFGQPAGPDAAGAALLSDVGEGASTNAGVAPASADSDPSVVDLRDSSLVVPLSPPPAYAGQGRRAPNPASRWTYEMTADAEPPPPPSTNRQLNALIAYFGPWLRDWYQGGATDALQETLWGLAENIPGQDRAKALYEFNESRVEFTKEMSEAYDPLMQLALGGATDAAAVLGSRTNRGSGLADTHFDSLQQRGGKVVVDAWAMAFDQFTGHFGAIDLGKLAPVSADGTSVVLRDVPAHPDAFRMRNLLIGRP